MKKRIALREPAILSAFVLLSACGGGGSSSGSGAVLAPAPTATPTSASSTATARVTITDPVGASTFAAKRLPSHLPRSARTITVAVNGGTPVSFPYAVNGPTCVTSSSTVTCTFDVQVPAGSDSIVVQALNSTGKLLSTATVQQDVSGTTVVPVTLAGMPNSAGVKLQQKTAPVGAAASIPIALSVFDVDNNPIVGPYATPVTLTDNDTSGHTSISPNPVGSSTTAVSLRFDGGLANVRVSTTLTSSGADGFAAAPIVHEYVVPSGTLVTSNAGTGTIVMGGDGAMWFGEQNGVGRVDASGRITEYPMVQPQQMVRGADGAVWFTTYYDTATGNSGELCRVASDGSVTKRNLQIVGPLVLASDGNFWNVDNNGYVKRVTPSGTVSTFNLTAPSTALNPGVRANDIVASPDGNLRVLDYGNDIIYTVTTSGSQIAATQMSGANVPYGGSAATFGADGAIWFGSQGDIIRTTTTGALTSYAQFPGTLTAINGIGFAPPLLSGPDNAIWTSGSWVYASNATVYRIAPSTGTILALPLPLVTSTSFSGQPPAVGLANGPNGTIWYVRGQSVGWFAPPA